MTIDDLLRTEKAAILGEATAAAVRLEHYHRDGRSLMERRLEELFREVAEAVRSRDLSGMSVHAGRVALERYEASFTLAELQSAFFMLEEAIRRRAAQRLAPDELAWGLGLVGTALTHGREVLARSYFRLEPNAYPVSADYAGVFAGAEGGRLGRGEELVFPA
jgi:hypothetical protein